MKRSLKGPFVPCLALVVLLGTALACAGGTSGGVVGSGERCSQTGGGGACEGMFNKLSGTYGMDIEDDNVFSGDAVQVQAEVSVESGTVRVSVESPDGEIASAEAAPGRAATLVGVAEADMEGFEVTFEAVDGDASGVTYRISYQIP